ncbi:MAG: tRNA uridine(34) 5-carboxymethylaminomethyl modification radical SAM/GNAT enzyme Elp3 [Candidatus Woesearchaeota archaeon]
MPEDEQKDEHIENVLAIKKQFFEEIIPWIIEHHPNKMDLSKKKRELSKKYKLQNVTDIEIYLNTPKESVNLVRTCLQTKPMRTGSGVAVIATMTMPFNCPHGSCTYCPGGLNSAFGDVPKSYTGKEPSTMRGIRNNYDPYRIIFNRLEQYIILGQNPDKVDQIIMGGTFPSYPKEYRDEYIYYSYKAYNDFSKLFFQNGILDVDRFREFFELPGNIYDTNRSERLKEKILLLKNQDIKILKEEQRINETATIRCIGLTIETKPDWAFADYGLEFLEYGATRVELGVQTVYDDILTKVHRGHTIEDTKKAIADLRDLGFKLNFHMMPGLPDVDGKRISREKDIASLKTIFSDPAYRPDMLKIYPCMVMPGTALEREFRKGNFTPLTTEEAADIIVEFKKYIPEYSRVMRVQRDIPTYATTAGVGRTNLRQYIRDLARERNVHCRCIRCREIGAREILAEPQIIIYEYDASSGKEFFISMEAGNNILGFVRLRFPPRSLHPSITTDSAIIRELHVYGQAVVIKGTDTTKTQHRGFGRKLVAKAEEIARSHEKNKMVVISGVGVKEYYWKLGYHNEGPYVAKEL